MNLRILSIDDDPVLSRSLRESLEADGHTVVSANQGENGVELFRAALRDNHPFSVVITDLGMPHRDGRQVAAAIKAASPSTPVMMLKGWGSACWQTTRFRQMSI
jgi:DNA-binding response OmpR family regulator